MRKALSLDLAFLLLAITNFIIVLWTDPNSYNQKKLYHLKTKRCWTSCDLQICAQSIWTSMSFFVSVGVTKRYTCSTMYMLCCWPTTLWACNGLLQDWLNQLKPRTVVFVTLRLTPVACSLCLHQELSTQIVLQSKTSIKESVCIAYLLDRGPKLSINYGRETAVLQGKIGIKKLNISS